MPVGHAIELGIQRALSLSRNVNLRVAGKRSVVVCGRNVSIFPNKRT